MAGVGGWLVGWWLVAFPGVYSFFFLLFFLFSILYLLIRVRPKDEGRGGGWQDSVEGSERHGTSHGMGSGTRVFVLCI